MNSQTVAILFLFLELLLLSSCERKAEVNNRPTREISGQLFVIQRNRINVKLGGVEVVFVPRSEFRKRCEWIASQKAVSKKLQEYKRNLEDSEKWLADARRYQSTALIRPFMNNAELLVQRAWQAFEGNALVKEHESVWSLLDSNEKLFLGTAFEGDDDSEWTASLLFFDWLNAFQGKKGTTNADGEFRISGIDESGGYLLAMSSRQFGAKEIENYYWIKEVDKETNCPINLSSSDCLERADIQQFLSEVQTSIDLSLQDVVRKMELEDLTRLQEARADLQSIFTSENRIEAIEAEIRNLERQRGELRSEVSP